MTDVTVDALARTYDEAAVAARLPAGVTVTAYGFLPDGRFRVTTDTDLTPAQADGFARYLTTTDDLEESRRTAAEDILAELDQLAAGSGTLTTAQLSAIIRRMARALAGLIRYTIAHRR